MDRRSLDKFPGAGPSMTPITLLVTPITLLAPADPLQAAWDRDCRVVRCNTLPFKSRPCYNFAALPGRFPRPTLRRPEARALRDPISAHRRALAQAVVPQVIATALASVAALLTQDGAWSLGVAAGGAAVIAGGWLSTRLALGGGVGPGTTALLRLLGGMLAKWVVVFAVLLAAVAGAGWPPVAVLAGTLVALVAQIVALARR